MLPENLQYSEGAEVLGGSWQALLQIIKHACLTITWKLPDFNYPLSIREHASQEIHYTISTGLLGGVTLRVVSLSTKFFIAPSLGSPRLLQLWASAAALVGRPWALVGDAQWGGLCRVTGPSRQAGTRLSTMGSTTGSSQWASSSPVAVGRNFPASLSIKRWICPK